ncbi:PREDICTED: adenylyltransferase and sulfurtransferase MOCS3 isoform X1 [Papilio xuthus]|uniref:Adenylyltransferase and sulfurtransferase MOCS3 homolog n=1 Tax=Papilio xuthus TaxID=66420 RepID=A0AAJ7E5I5_PAPXU|nr:PREDICTED: adenylyltransferase and sulfurtransferase MOCS3 isoform X1 [Papilio xuthus]
MEQIQRLEQEIDHLRKTLQEKENELFEMKRNWMPMESNDTQPEFTTLYSRNESNVGKVQYGDKLPKWAIERYSRQILLPDIGVAGQEKLCKAKVLIVGAGGLGCPAAVYLAGAGVGEIGIIDYDKVDLTNIHRQILHAECDQNKSKAVSAAETLKSINSNIKITPYMLQLDSSNALDIISKYDVILDCTDNVPTRYLLNDACVMNKLPLISGSALKMEGQLTIYGYRSGRNQNEKELYQGGCYRCLFPNPPPAETVGSCSANGVAGPIPGVIGALQSLEAIKLIVGQTRDKLLVERFLIFDGDDVTFRTVKLRSRDPNCPMCSENPKITNLIDYEVFCKSQAKEKDLDLQILPSENRITAFQLKEELGNSSMKQRHLLIDVRNEAEFNMCRIDGAVNYPIEQFRDAKVDEVLKMIDENSKVTFICRRGNDSQIAAKIILDKGNEDHKGKIKDLIGGLHSWSEYIDHDFPVY